jgi:hypothetical protein
VRGVVLPAGRSSISRWPRASEQASQAHLRFLAEDDAARGWITLWTGPLPGGGGSPWAEFRLEQHASIVLGLR